MQLLKATYWEFGRRIVEFEQKGEAKASYGEEVLKRLSQDLTHRFGRGFSRQNLQQMRQFYLVYQPEKLCQTLSGKSPKEISINEKLIRKFNLNDLASAFPLYLVLNDSYFFTAFTIAKMPALISCGRSGQASITAFRSGEISISVVGRLCARCGLDVVFEGPEVVSDSSEPVRWSTGAELMRPFICLGLEGLCPEFCLWCPEVSFTDEQLIEASTPAASIF